MKKIMVIMTALLAVIGLSACSKDPGYTNISNDELREMFDSGDTYQYIDVRTSDEYYAAHIAQFTRNIDYYHLEDDYSLLDNLDKNIPVVIMCNSGNRSVSASEIFVDQGFVEV